MCGGCLSARDKLVFMQVVLAAEVSRGGVCPDVTANCAHGGRWETGAIMEISRNLPHFAPLVVDRLVWAVRLCSAYVESFPGWVPNVI